MSVPPRVFVSLLGAVSLVACRAGPHPNWVLTFQVYDETAYHPEGEPEAVGHSPWSLEVSLDPGEGGDSASTCPVGQLEGATMNGEEAWVQSGSFDSNWLFSSCVGSTAHWSLDEAPDSLEIELGRYGDYSIELPLVELTRLRPEEPLVRYGDPIAFAADPPLSSDDEIWVHGYHKHRDPWPELGCWDSATVSYGDILGVADHFTYWTTYPDDLGACAVHVSLHPEPVDLEPCKVESCTLSGARHHIESLAIAEDGWP